MVSEQKLKEEYSGVGLLKVGGCRQRSNRRVRCSRALYKWNTKKRGCDDGGGGKKCWKEGINRV